MLNSVPAAADVPLWVNLFEITNLSELRFTYRLLGVSGLQTDEQFDRNLQLLVSGLAYEMRQPVARVRRGQQHFVAVPADVQLPKLKRQLIPHAVDLIPDAERHELAFSELEESTTPIAHAFLQFALRTPIYRDRTIWQNGRAWFGKQPRVSDGRSTIDVYDGFRSAVVITGDGRAFLSVDLAAAYIDRLWLPQRLNGGDFGPYRGRRALYHFGPNWYPVQLAGLPGKSVAEQTFVLEAGRHVDVLSYTREKWPHDPVVAQLAPSSPAVVYRNVGNDRERYGALGLCKLSYATHHPEVARLHRASIVDPTQRFARASAIVRRQFAKVELSGQPIRVTDQPHRIERRVFTFPAQRFGHDRVLGTQAGPGITDVAPLDRVGRRRLDLLLDARAGALDRAPFDAQYALVPKGLARSIAEDFVDRFQNSMRTVSGQANYATKTVLYEDGNARSLFQQLTVIDRALRDAGITRGYALLVLPTAAHADLHHQVKYRHWPDLQIQCAAQPKLLSHYDARSGQTCAVRPGMEGKLANYIRNVALGMLSANRKWPWALASPLNYDVYLGIDVLNRIAGITCVLEAGARIVFKDYKSTQPERLTFAQTRQMVTETLGNTLRQSGILPRTIVVQRDGRTFASERRGLTAAVHALVDQGLLPIDVQLGIVEVHKSSGDRLRLAQGSLAQLSNPTVGSYYILRPRSGIIATTGLPFAFQGTSDPLALEVVEGPLEIEKVLQDTYALSTLIYSAPDRCGRLPVTIRLADDLLEPIAGADPEDEAALYDLDGEEDADRQPVDLALATAEGRSR